MKNMKNKFKRKERKGTREVRKDIDFLLA